MSKRIVDIRTGLQPYGSKPVVPLRHMTRFLGVAAGLVFALLGFGIDAGAQTTEVAAFGGIGFGGSLVSPASGGSTDIEVGPVYGGAVSTALSSTWRFEGSFSRQESRVAGERSGTYIHVAQERYLAGFQEELPWGNRRAFGTFLIGATRSVPAGAGDEWWFTIGLGLGFKTRLSARVGFRFEARGYYTPVTVGGVTVCGAGGCFFRYTGSGVFQGDVTAGVFFGF
jgi:hypothetical protein